MMPRGCEDKPELAAAILEVQGKLQIVDADMENAYFNTQYTSLKKLRFELRTPLADAGLLVMQYPGACQDGVLVIHTFITHAETCQTMEFATSVPVGEGASLHRFGAAITYARRYILVSFFFLVTGDEDDTDGNETSLAGRGYAEAAMPAITGTISANDLKTLRALIRRSPITEKEITQVQSLKTLTDLPAERVPALLARIGDMVQLTDQAAEKEREELALIAEEEHIEEATS